MDFLSDSYSKNGSGLHSNYHNAHPFAHGVYPNFLKEDVAAKAADQFPKPGDEWIHYVHFNEKKHGLNKLDEIPTALAEVITQCSSAPFLKWLEEVSGIQNLQADPLLEGGGLHQTLNGGFLNIHADFTTHPRKRNLKRRLNLLIYLNPEWKEEWGGHLELWDEKMEKCEQRIAPNYNQAIIFTTDAKSYHGQPEPVTCPENQSRRSIALYYYTDEHKMLPLQSTNYQARPFERWKAPLVWADKKAVAVYSFMKNKLGFNDKIVGHVLNVISGKKKD